MYEPQFNSMITDYVIDLEFLRRQSQETSTEPILYDQFRRIFRDLDALASARIDGNKTGLSKYLEAKEEADETKGHKTTEIDKISHSIEFIDNHIQETVFYSGLFTKLHHLIRDDITKESTRNSGKYRRGAKEESACPATAPPHHLIPTYIDNLIAFINKGSHSKYDAIKTMLVHQKFLWIHPFRESNGLLSRLITYTMLKKAGYDGINNRIVNASMSVCPDIPQYLHFLKKADSGSDKDIRDWLCFSLKGFRDNQDKLMQLLDYDFVKEHIIMPALKHPLFDRLFTDQDRLIMDIAVEKQVFQAADIRMFFPQKHASEISKMLRWLKDKELLINLEDNSRKYAVNLNNKHLVKPIIAKLDKNGFLPFDK